MQLTENKPRNQERRKPSRIAVFTVRQAISPDFTSACQRRVNEEHHCQRRFFRGRGSVWGLSKEVADAPRKRLFDPREGYGAPEFTYQQLRVTCSTSLTNAGGIYAAESAFQEQGSVLWYPSERKGQHGQHRKAL